MSRQMRQIADPRAPFASIDEALDAGEQHIRQLGWSFVGAAAEEQPGGYFVRIVGIAPFRGRGSRGRRNHPRQETAEVGKIERSPKP